MLKIHRQKIEAQHITAVTWSSPFWGKRLHFISHVSDSSPSEYQSNYHTKQRGRRMQTGAFKVSRSQSSVFTTPPNLLLFFQLLGCFINITLSGLAFFCSPSFSLPPSMLGEVHGHALIGLEPSNYLSNDIGCFSEILTPADVGACQEVLDQTHSDVITPTKERRTEENEEKERSNWLFLFIVEEKILMKNESTELEVSSKCEYFWVIHLANGANSDKVKSAYSYRIWSHPIHPHPNMVFLWPAGWRLAGWAEQTHCLLRPGKTSLIMT